MMALAQEMFQTKTILKLPKLVPEIAKNVETNLSLRQMMALAGIGPRLLRRTTFRPDPARVLLPHAGISYWVADKKIAGTILDDLLAGKTVAVVQDSPFPDGTGHAGTSGLQKVTTKRTRPPGPKPQATPPTPSPLALPASPQGRVMSKGFNPMIF